MPLTPEEQQELAQLQAELGQAVMQPPSLPNNNQSVPSPARVDFERRIAANQMGLPLSAMPTYAQGIEELSLIPQFANYNYKLIPPQKPIIRNAKDIVRGFPVQNPNIPVKGLVFHITAKPEIESQKQAMQRNRVGYNAIIDEEGSVDFYSPFSLTAQQILPPNNPQRLDPRIPKEIRQKYRKFSNSNVVSIGIMKNLTDKNKASVFDVAARFFAANNIPLKKESIIGHGEIQYSPDILPRSERRQLLGKKQTPEGQEFKDFILKNWTEFTQRVKLYQQNQLTKEEPL